MRNYPTGKDYVGPVDIVAAQDNLTFEGARRLGRTILTYWRQRGFDTVETFVEQLPAKRTSRRVGDQLIPCEPEKLFTVKSNLVNGLPPL